MGGKLTKTREEEFLEEIGFFRRNAFLIIEEMVKLSPEHPSVLVDEVLHSIFFLGLIKKQKVSPEDIVSDNDMLTVLKGRYPEPFVLCRYQLPKRSPISCVLDMIVHLKGQENEEKIIKKLQKLICRLKEGKTKELVSSTICVSQKDKKIPNSVRYYGVSMSTSGRNPGRIVIAASCLSTWDSYVAGAVMTYYPEDRTQDFIGTSERPNRDKFDATIKLPEQVRCQAFSLSDGREMPPCKSCQNLFGLTPNETRPWPYGNCAEAESVSNLLKNEQEVREHVRRTSNTYTDGKREKVKDSVKTYLQKNILNLLEPKFVWGRLYYEIE